MVGTLRTRDRDVPLTVEALALPENAELRQGTAKIWAGTDDFDDVGFRADPIDGALPR